jgi:hypothetical protein
MTYHPVRNVAHIIVSHNARVPDSNYVTLDNMTAIDDIGTSEKIGNLTRTVIFVVL